VAPKKRCEIQGGGQEIAANGKNLNIDNSELDVIKPGLSDLPLFCEAQWQAIYHKNKR